MPETDQQSIASIIKEIDNVSNMMTGKSQADLEDDLILERAVCMTLGLIGEKATKIFIPRKLSIQKFRAKVSPTG